MIQKIYQNTTIYFNNNLEKFVKKLEENLLSPGTIVQDLTNSLKFSKQQWENALQLTHQQCRVKEID